MNNQATTTGHRRRKLATDTNGQSKSRINDSFMAHMKTLDGGLIVPSSLYEEINPWKTFPDMALFAETNQKNPPLSEEADIQIWEDENFTFWRTITNPNPIIAKEEYSKGLRILEEMIPKDTDISTALVDRGNAVAALDHDVLPAEPDDATLQEQADLFKADLEETDLSALLTSFTYDDYFGFGVREIPWHWKHNDHWAFKDLEPIPQRAWTFDKETGAARLLPNEQDQAGVGIEISPGRFLYTLHRHPINGKNPYGHASGLDVYYAARWRNWVIRALLSAAAKVGGTNVIAKFLRGSTEDQQTALLQAAEAIQNGQAIVIPEDQSIEIPEHGRASIKDFFSVLDDMFARMIKKRLTGAEFTSGRGAASPTGTLAETKVHKQVSDVWKEGAAKYVINAVNQLARMWTDFNYGHENPAPEFTLDFEGKEDQKLVVENTQTALSFMPLKEIEVYKRLGWSIPAPGDAIIPVQQKQSPFGNPSMFDMASGNQPVAAELAPQKQLPAKTPPQNKPDNIDDATETPEFHEHNLPEPIGQSSHATFQENTKLAKQWETEQEILTGKIIADAQDNPESYPVFINEIKNDLDEADPETYDEARKAIGATSTSAKATFRDYMMGAQGSVFTLHTVQQLNKFTEDMQANFSEKDTHILYACIKIEGDKTNFQETQQIDLMPFDRAMEILRRRAPNLSAQYYQLVENDLHGWATTVSGLESQATVKAVIDSLNKAEEAGTNFNQWRNDIDEILDSEDIEKLRPGQLETVFRTNLQTAYNAAGERLVNDVDPSGELYPAYQFLNGDPQSTICIPRDGKVFPRSDKSNIPPLHFNCKSYIIWLSKFEDVTTAPESTREQLPPPDKGFDRSPNQLLGAGIS